MIDFLYKSGEKALGFCQGISIPALGFISIIMSYCVVFTFFVIIALIIRKVLKYASRIKKLTRNPRVENK